MASFATPIPLRFPHVTLPIEETLYGQDVPPMMVRCISDGWFRRAEEYPNARDGDRFLVRRDVITHIDTPYTVDYISAKVLGTWFRYTVVYHPNHASPFPPTIDYRISPATPAALTEAIPSAQLFSLS